MEGQKSNTIPMLRGTGNGEQEEDGKMIRTSGRALHVERAGQGRAGAMDRRCRCAEDVGELD